MKIVSFILRDFSYFSDKIVNISIKIFTLTNIFRIEKKDKEDNNQTFWLKNKLPTISIKNTATDDSSMIITVMHFSGILFVKVLINNAPNISAHWKGNNERQGKAITFNPTIKVRVIYISAYHSLTYFVFFVKHTSFFHHLFVFYISPINWHWSFWKILPPHRVAIPRIQYLLLIFLDAYSSIANHFV